MPHPRAWREVGDWPRGLQSICAMSAFVARGIPRSDRNGSLRLTGRHSGERSTDLVTQYACLGFRPQVAVAEHPLYSLRPGCDGTILQIPGRDMRRPRVRPGTFSEEMRVDRWNAVAKVCWRWTRNERWGSVRLGKRMRRSRIGRSGLTIVVALSILVGSATATPNDQLSLLPCHDIASVDLPARERELIDDAADQHLDRHSFVEACLIAGGLPFGHDLDQLVDQWWRISQYGAVHGVVDLYEQMHHDLLSADYVPTADSLAHLMQTGEYNCLSASLMFLALCQHHHVDAQLVTMPGHVRVHLDAFPNVDIETTCPRWRDAVVPIPTDGWRRLTTMEVIAKVYYNRATRAIERRDWGAAVGFADLACLLDPADRSAADNRITALNEWALANWQLGDGARAERLLEKGLVLDPDNEVIRSNHVLIRQHAAAQQQAGPNRLPNSPRDRLPR